LSAVAGERTTADSVRFVPIADKRTVQADSVKIVPNTAEDALYVHTDQLGTPRKLTDPTGAVVWDASLTPYGMEDSIAGTETLDSRFPGQWADAESGLNYNYFRDYDPTLGRYIQSDPIGLRGGLNTYAYVGGNPISYTDPKGLEALVFGDETDGKPVGSTKDILIGVAPIAAPFILAAPGAGAICALVGRAALALAPKGASTIAKAVDPNKLKHIFGQPRHNLSDVVKQLGSEEKAFNAIQQATETAVRSQGLKGVFETVVKVGTKSVTVRGNVIDGAVKIGTAFIP